MSGRAVRLASVIDSSVAKECSVPLINKKIEPERKDDDVEGQVGFKMTNIEEMRQRRKAPTQEEVRQKVKISLQDCFSCSGCITSAETVLVEHHNTDEVEKMLREHGSETIITISIQSLISIAELLTPKGTMDTLTSEIVENVILGTLQGISTVLKSRGAMSVVPLFISQLLSCESAYNELNEGRHDSSVKKSLLPVCPGWVCLCTKTYPDLTKKLSHSMSPMAIYGYYIRDILSKSQKKGSRYYHISVQPCYDRKLEAARPDLENTCDLVITSNELLSLMRKDPRSEDIIVNSIQDGIVNNLLEEKDLSKISWNGEFTENPTFGPIIPYSCGGYVEYIVDRLTNDNYTLLERKEIGKHEKLTMLQGPNREIVTLAYVASLSGIYNMTVSLKTDNSYDFVEAFACDAGCERGNGQTQYRGSALTRGLVLMDLLRAKKLKEGIKQWENQLPSEMLGVKGITLSNMYSKMSHIIKTRVTLEWKPAEQKPKDRNVIYSSELDW